MTATKTVVAANMTLLLEAALGVVLVSLPDLVSLLAGGAVVLVAGAVVFWAGGLVPVVVGVELVVVGTVDGAVVVIPSGSFPLTHWRARGSGPSGRGPEKSCCSPKMRLTPYSE